MLNQYRYLRKNARVGCVKCAGTVTPHVNRFPAGTLRYQETEKYTFPPKKFWGLVLQLYLVA
jgi:hypothetical protein